MKQFDARASYSQNQTLRFALSRLHSRKPSRPDSRSKAKTSELKQLELLCFISIYGGFALFFFSFRSFLVLRRRHVIDVF
jgi:hypothetical protein